MAAALITAVVRDQISSFPQDRSHEMSLQSEMDVDPKKKRVRVLRAGVVTILLVVLAIVFLTGVFWFKGITSLPSVRRQSEEVAALETHVLPLFKDFRATWYLNDLF